MPPKKDLSGFKKISNTLNNIAASDLELELEDKLRKGATSKELRELYMPKVTAKSILLALTADDKVANSAIRDLTHQHEGKPVEKKEIRHHLEKLSDQELDAMLLTEIDDLKAETKVKSKITLQ